MNNKFFIICLAVIFFTLVTKAQWQQTNGPYGGPISCFVFSGNNIFAGSPYGGVFFSADNGNSWISVNNGLTDIQITSLVVIGTNIFAGTSSSGVFLSTNDGGIWIPVNTGMTGYDLMITCLAINGTTIFAGTYNGIFSSSNSGESWIKKSYITSVRSILVSGTNIFAANYNGVYLSTNNGTSWTLKNTGLTSHNISCLALSGSNIFAGTSNPAAGVFLSTNNGASWTAVNNGLSWLNVSTISAYGSNIFIGISGSSVGGVFLSTNNGANWTAANSGIYDYYNISELATNGVQLFASTSSNIYSSTTNGAYWSEAFNGMINTNIAATAVAGSSILAGTSDNNLGGLYLLDSNDSSWIKINLNSMWTHDFINCFGTNGTKVFTGTHGYGVFLSNDNGYNWIEVSNGLPAWGNISSLAIEGTNIFAALSGYGSEYGVFLSNDNGNNWTKMSNGLPENPSFSAIVARGTDIFASTMSYDDAGVYFSPDNGMNWTAVNLGLPSGAILSLAISGINIFAGTANNGVYFSSNNGSNWTAANIGLSNTSIHALAVDGTTIYAGTDFGVFLSDNNGSSWTEFNANLPALSINSFAINNTSIYAGTCGGGVFVRSLNSPSPVMNLTGNLFFGNVTINHPAQRDFTIENLSSTYLTISSIDYPDGFSGSWGGGPIAAGTSKIVTVTFSPNAVQSFSGEVTVNSQVGSGINTLPVSGNGLQNTPGLSVSGNLDFGTVQQGSVDDRPLFLYNNTSSLITIDNIIPTPTGVFGAIMQNGTTILPNHSLPVSVFFYPPGLLTYNNTFTVTSDAPNGTVTFTATGKGENAPISWIGFKTMPENNPEINQQKILDEHFITQTSPDPIKICADGSKATTVEFINNDPGISTESIIFNMKSDPWVDNPGFSGWFVTSDYTRVGNTITARYTHPKYLNTDNLYRKDTIQVINSADGNIIYKQPVQIYRAPVILVHGIWGDFTGMLPLYGALLNSGKYNNILLRVTDYTGTNACSFFANSLIIKDEINSSIQGLQLMKYSVGKVDIIAHSMGGILSRIYLQGNDCHNGIRSNCYRGDIHKLITLNTPHSGTQIANFLLSNSIGAWLAKTTLEWNDQRWDQGAVDDLRCDSPAITSLNGSLLNNHIVPCYAIQTETNVTVFDKYAANENSLTHVIADARVQSAQNFNNQVFADSKNDLIVPSFSQRGGLSGFSYFEDVMHTASPDNSSVISTIKILLDENPANSVYFDQNMTGFDPAQITPTFSKTEGFEPDPYPGRKTGLVTITSPTTGFSCSEGDTVKIDVSSSPNINHLLVLINNKNTGIALFDTVANSATFYYSVPKNIAGDIKIMAIGYDSTGFVDMDTLDIFTNLTAPLDSMTFFKENIDIQLGQSVPITLFGYFHDLTLRNISQLYGTEYDFSDSTIVSMNPGNVMKGLAIGQTILHSVNQNKHAYVYVTVYNLSQQLENIIISDGNNNCYNATQIITVAGDTNTFTVQNGGSVTMIAGQNILYQPGTTVESGGYMWGYIAPSGPWCQTPSMPAVVTGESEILPITQQSSFKVYPNPTTGNFILELSGESIADKVTVDIYGIWGEKVLSTVLNRERKHEFSLSGRPVGVYFIRVISGDKAETVKIIKQ